MELEVVWTGAKHGRDRISKRLSAVGIGDCRVPPEELSDWRHVAGEGLRMWSRGRKAYLVEEVSILLAGMKPGGAEYCKTEEIRMLCSVGPVHREQHECR